VPEITPRSVVTVLDALYRNGAVHLTVQTARRFTPKVDLPSSIAHLDGLGVSTGIHFLGAHEFFLRRVPGGDLT
jgi:hypothetical protein